MMIELSECKAGGRVTRLRERLECCEVNTGI